MERYITRRQNRSPATIAQYKRTLPHFVEFAEAKQITQPSGLSTSLIDSYIERLFNEFDSDSTILTYTKNVRAWLVWLNKRNLCSEALYHLLDKDELGLNPTARDEALPEPEAISIIQKLQEQRRGSAHHAITELAWNAGPRLGEIHSLDLKDFEPADNDLYFRNRPEKGTRLKNGDARDSMPGDGERDVILQPRVVNAIRHYVQTERPDVTDEYGRQPLFATQHGRAARSTLRRWIYEATSCRWADQTSAKQTCDGSCDPDSNVCPLSYNPHAVRRGAIVSHLSGGLRRDRASERFDVSMKVIAKHYDPREKQRKKQDRSEAVRNSWTEW